MSAHNGEINTLRGNINWMRAREATLRAPPFGDELERCLPLIADGASDSAAFDRALELLLLAGRSLPHALMMMIPMAHESQPGARRRSSTASTATTRALIEPWDGPAAIVFTDGRMLGATLDRNGLRPGRWLVTDDGWVVLGSEAGVVSFDAERIVTAGAPAPRPPVRRRPRDRARLRRRRGRARGRAAAARTASGTPSGAISPRRPARAKPPAPRARAARQAPARLRLHARRTCGSLLAPDRPATRRSRPARWATTSRSPSSPSTRPRSSPTSSSASRRSPTRRSTRSARRS